MPTRTAYGDSHPSFLTFWLRVREFAVPPSMIETATARRLAGDWAGACAAARVDVDLDLRSVARAHGRELADRVRHDLRGLAPDLLRWHMPRIAPHGLLRPGLTIPLARYDPVRPGHTGPVHLVARTPPAWADGGQRISLTLWDGSAREAAARRHPHPRPSRRFRLDLHRHLWDARSAAELRVRAGADGPATADPAVTGVPVPLPEGFRCAVDRWAAEAGHLLRAEGSSGGPVAVRVGPRHQLTLDVRPDPVPHADGPGWRITSVSRDGGGAAVPVLPDAATWVLPDLDLLRAGAIEAGLLHPLVASALVPDRAPPGPTSPGEDPAGGPRFVECRGARHRIGLADGVLAALDHDPDEIRREELLVALGGTPLPCLRAIDEAHRRPDCLVGVRERLHHGDIAGALAVVEGLLGPDATLRGGALRDALEAAARRRIAYGLFRAGLDGPALHRARPAQRRPRDHRPHPRHARTAR
ncbi:hypothetical protein M5362_10850 [Streptomyces sp. Je 1-79]|uniref:hypothetical protein n=1 Tax=Streptomyces sp. Je 1-79 TaxID=2943847 RepID=UPI0021A7CC2F|nr:hypothetical protein [Streptomyces sp. Je 1-79]MCT4353626.1 hypothetical protein [Streptomyces sp. Je 1-79]